MDTTVTPSRKKLSRSDIWYYYKWHFVIASAILLVLAIVVTQCATRIRPDVYVTYAGDRYLSPNEVKRVEEALRTAMSYDYDGKHGKQTVLRDLVAMSAEQFADKGNLVSRDGYVYLGNNSGRDTLQKEMMSGETVFFILSEALYNECVKADRLMLIDDLELGALPSNVRLTDDGFGIYLHGTSFAENFSVMRDFPEDTVICVRRQTAVSMLEPAKKRQARFDRAAQLMKDIINYRV